MGDEQDQDFVCLELINQILIYSFNLGDGTVQLEATNKTTLDEWQNVEISRKGRQGTLIVNGQEVGVVSTNGQMDRLSVEGSLYVGGYPGEPPYRGINPTNFSGCIEELHLDVNPVVLSTSMGENSVGVRPGCAVEPTTLATFPIPQDGYQPGYIQLNGMDLDGRMEISFMFRTLQVFQL